jgi:ribonuclease BN (tRNA processing enzyme)
VRLTVIGCSPAWPNAGGAQSGYLVEGRGRLLLDCGPGVLARLRNGNGGWPAVDAIAITHFHLDHWGDLVPWTFGAAFGPGRDASRPELWLPPGGEERLRSFGGPLSFSDMLGSAFELREYGDATFSAGGFDVTPVQLAHYEELTFGLRVSDGSHTLAYSGDTAPTPRLADLARDADVFLCEATLGDPEPAERGHLTADEAAEAFEASGARRLVVIHRPDELPLDPSIERAHDGLELEL